MIYTKKDLLFSVQQETQFIISGAGDKTIRFWQQSNQTNWINSQLYVQHTDDVICRILNSNEDLQFSGSDDRSIKVIIILLHQFKIRQKIMQYHKIKLVFGKEENKTSKNSKVQLQLMKFHKLRLSSFSPINNQFKNKGKRLSLLQRNNLFGQLVIVKQTDYVFQLKDGIFEDNQEQQFNNKLQLNLK
ncbi:unnamed protein product [Paramecium primaurelia]|uniref:Uncharacterized protein n=1 Tax=Paramecium primaurelia TaxID=5886 RepID=A0A8S1QVA2_PARPR|nr:unnamed protein product [Paramecium primaurelia]